MKHTLYALRTTFKHALGFMQISSEPSRNIEQLYEQRKERVRLFIHSKAEDAPIAKRRFIWEITKIWIISHFQRCNTI